MEREERDREVPAPGRGGRQSGSASDLASDAAATEKSGKDTRVLADSSPKAAVAPRGGLRGALAELQQANAERDADRSCRAARDLRYKLERAREAPQNGGAAEIEEITREAAPHLAAAFEASAAALDALAAGDTSIYKRETARWKGDVSPGAGAPTLPTARPASPTDIAQQGTAGPAHAFPHRDRIQAAFGAHDISGIRAHVGGDASTASDALGARAFAFGQDVAFADTPDLHTAAHEAAHHVQQRGGVSLSGGLDTPGDAHEQHADQVADAVVRGESVAPLLDPNDAAASSAGASSSSVVQRKPAGASPASTAPVRQLPEGQHYKVAGDYACLLDVAWYSEGAVRQGDRLVSIPKTTEMLAYLRSAGMFSWATPETLADAAKLLGIPAGLKSPEVTIRIGANVLAVIGLPPNSSAMVSRSGDGLRVAVRLETAGSDAGMVTVKGSTVDAVYRALEAFTGLAIPKDARVDAFPMHVGNGAVYRDVHGRDLENFFGAKAWSAWKKEHSGGEAGASGAENASDTRSVAAELTDAERTRLTAWLANNLGSLTNDGSSAALSREMLAMIDDVETGSLKRYRGGILDHLRKHKVGNGTQITPTLLRQAIDNAMDKSVAPDDGSDASPADPILAEALPATLTYGQGLALDGDTVRFQVAFDWAALHKRASGKFDDTQQGDEFAKRPWNAEVRWVFDRIGGGNKEKLGLSGLLRDVVETRHDSSDIHVGHKLALDPGEQEGTWLVHAFVRTSHFPLTRVSTQIQVKSERARMNDLRSEALGGLANPAALQEDDGRFTGPLAFKPRSDNERAEGRQREIARLEQVRDYLRLHAGGSPDAIAAVEKQIERRREQDTKIAGDKINGWRTFDVRATFLSKVDEVPSGALDIYGAFKMEETSTGVALPTVMLRDQSRRFEQTEYTFKGIGTNFEEALADATKQLTKDYPRGRLALFAEEQDPTGQRSTGKTIGFERETYSTWKAVKEKVFHPLAQIAVAAASAAVMIFVPPAAAAIPLLIETVYQTVQTADDLITRSQNGTLSSTMMAVDIGSIGLGVMPFLSMAKPIRTSARTMFALEIANLGGQGLLMAANVKETLAAMQAQDVAVIAQMYGELLDAEKTHQASDPRLAEKRAQIEARAQGVRARLRDAVSEVAGQQMLFMLPGHVFKGVQAGRQAKEQTDAGWAPSDLGTPVEQTDWAGMHRELSEDTPDPATERTPTRAVKPTSPGDEGHGKDSGATPKEIPPTADADTAPSQIVTDSQSLRRTRARYEAEGVQTSPIQYDPATSTAHFEITYKTGVKTRVEAPVGKVTSFGELQGAQNKVVGHPVDKSTGFALIERLNRGDASALASVGISDAANGKLPQDHEFGLGELPPPDGRVVLVIGESAAVDWVYLPGMKPRAHTHPPSVHDIPKQAGGERSIPLAELVKPTSEAYMPREVVFPTGADVIVMAHDGVDWHVVATEFVLRDGNVMKAPDGDTGPRLVFTILGAREIGTVSDGRSVYKARIIGKSGAETPVNHDVWVVAYGNGESGDLFMTPPADLVLREPGKTAARTESTSANGGGSAKVGARATEPPGAGPAKPAANGDAMSPALGGRIAEMVPGATYRGDGVFTVSIGDDEVTLRIRRTSGRARVVHEGDQLVLEIPRDLGEAELGHAIADGLAEVQSARFLERSSQAGAASGPKTASEGKNAGARIAEGIAAGVSGSEREPAGTRPNRPAPQADATDSARAKVDPVRVAQVRAHVDEALARVGAPAGDYRVKVLDETSYANKFGGDRGHAAMIIEGDQPTIYASHSATREDIAHEATHIAQLRDGSRPDVQENIRILSVETLDPSRWKDSDPGLRKNLYERHLAVEIDAAQRELASATGEARVQIERDLASMRADQAKVAAITEEQLLLMKAKALAVPSYLENPSVLFARKRGVVEGQKQSPYGAKPSTEHARVPIDDSPTAKALGAAAVQVGEAWTEAVVVTTAYKGVVVAIQREGKGKVVHIKQENGTVRRYTAAPDAIETVAVGDPVENGTPVFHEKSRSYRLVEVDGKLHVEEQIKNAWKQAGEHVRMRGLITEDAARAQVDAELASEMQKPPDQRRDQMTGYVRIDNQTGSGAGLDDVIVEFHGEPEKPVAKPRIIETKDYPNRDVPLADMTAIRENLETNRDRLRATVQRAIGQVPQERPASLRELSKPQLVAILEALDEGRVTVELRLGPTTKVSDTTLTKLRAELRNAFGGNDVLAPMPKTVEQRYIDAETKKRFPSSEVAP